MSGLFRSNRGIVDFAANQGIVKGDSMVVQQTSAASTPTPAASTMPAAPTPAAGLGETRSPVTRASTMLSNRRAGDDVRVGTKKLLGQ